MAPTIFSRRAGLFGLAALLAAGAACGGEGAKTTEAAATIVTETTAAPTTTTTVFKPAANFDDLSRLLLTSVPPEYKVQPNDVGDTGPSDLAKAVKDDGEKDARAFLTKAGFVRGYQRLWLKSDDEQVVVFLYQFNDHAGAVDYGNRGSDPGTAKESGFTVTPFEVPGIEGAIGMTAHDGQFASSAVIFSKGPYLVQLMANGPTPAGLPDLAKTLAADQFGRL